MRQDSLFRPFFAAILIVCSSYTGAQAQGEHSVPIRTAAPMQQQSMPTENDMEVTILRDNYAGTYNLSTLDNLSKLYWRLGAFDSGDDDAIRNYLKIHECKLYTEYMNDDLEWKEIIETMKVHLTQVRDTFPINFQFMLQLHLGRYDSALGGFPVIDKTGFKNAKRIEVSSISRDREICHDKKPMRSYPTNLLLLPTQPFTLDFVNLDEHVAQAYILRKKSEISQLPEEKRINRYERDAYLRLRVTFTQYHGNVDGERNDTVAILYGRIDGYELFEDVEQKRLMVSVSYDHDTKPSAPEMSLPKQQPQ